MSDFARWIVAAEMLTTIAALAAIIALHPLAARRAPHSWRWALTAVGLILAGVTIAVLINALVAGPQTPGVKLLAYIAGPAAGMSIVGVCVAFRQRPTDLAEHRQAAVVANAALLADALSHLPHLEPCGNPDCQPVRDNLTALGGSTPGVPRR